VAKLKLLRLRPLLLKLLLALLPPLLALHLWLLKLLPGLLLPLLQ